MEVHVKPRTMRGVMFVALLVLCCGVEASARASRADESGPPAQRSHDRKATAFKEGEDQDEDEDDDDDDDDEEEDDADEEASGTMAESLDPPPSQEDIALDDAFWDEEDWLADAEGEEWEIEAGFL